MTAHRLINIGLVITFTAFAAAMLSASHLLGPDDIETEKLTMRDIQAAQRQAHQRARFEKAAQLACGENAGFAELGGNAVQCFTKRGYRTRVAEVSL